MSLFWSGFSWNGCYSTTVYHSAAASHFKSVLLEAFSAFSYFSIKNDYLSSTEVTLPRSQIILERTTWNDIFQVLDVQLKGERQRHLGEDSGRRANRMFFWRKKLTCNWGTLPIELWLQARWNKTKSCTVALLKFGSEMWNYCLLKKIKWIH